MHPPKKNPTNFECISEFVFLFLFISEKIFYVAQNRKYLSVLVQLCNYLWSWSIHRNLPSLLVFLPWGEKKLKQKYNCLPSSLLHQIWKTEVPCFFLLAYFFFFFLRIIASGDETSLLINRTKYMLWKWLSAYSLIN